MLKTESEALKTSIAKSENILFRKAIEDLQQNILSNMQCIEALHIQLSRRPPQEHNCDICGYTNSSETVLKSHKTRQHKLEELRHYKVL